MSATLEQQLREYTGAVSRSQAPISADEAQLLVSAVRELPERRLSEKRSRAVWIAAAAAIVVLVAIGAITALRAQPDGSVPPASDPVPQTTEAGPATTQSRLPTTAGTPAPSSGSTSTTVAVEGSAVSASWVMATGAVPAYRGFGVSPVVTNGSAYLGVTGRVSGGGWIDTGLVRSVNGIVWEQVASAPPTDFGWHSPIAAGPHFLLGDEAARNSCANSGSGCSVFVSADGLTWRSEPWEPQQPSAVLHHWVWRVQDEATVRHASPEDLEPGDAFDAVVMEFPDRLIQFGINHLGHGFEYRQSTTSGIWTQLESAPPFASTLTPDYLSAGWQSMWRCEFTARAHQGMALIGTADGLELWTTTDGVAWNRLPNPPVQAVDSQRGFCIHAADEGWVLAPGGVSGDDVAGQPGWEPILATPQSILFSPDGSTWTRVEYSADVAEFEGMIEVAGNTIYIFDPRTAQLLVGTILPE